VYQLETHREELSARAATFQEQSGLPPDELLRLAKDVEKEMRRAARDLEFERAAELRDRLTEIRKRLEEGGDAGGGAGGAGGDGVARPRAGTERGRARPRGRR